MPDNQKTKACSASDMIKNKQKHPPHSIAANTLKPILWKEWHEQRWKTAFATVMLTFFTTTFLAAELTTANEAIGIMWIIGVMLFALYRRHGRLRPEHANHTRLFLHAKPIPPWQIFLAKWFISLNVIIPMIVCSLTIALYTLIAKPAQNLNLTYIAKGTLTAIMLATMFYTLITCLAPAKSSEAFVGLFGLFITVAMIAHLYISTITIVQKPYHHATIQLIEEIILFLNPFFIIHLMEPLYGIQNTTTLYLTQATLFTLTIAYGIRKTARSI